MGLDAYAFAVKFPDGPIQDEVDFGEQINDPETGELRPNVSKEELHYWRKHHDLQGFMGSLYNEKGGKEEFNCVPVMLTVGDLDRLKAMTEGDQLPETSGFFFGRGNTEYYKAETLKFVNDAKASIADGWQVYYDSWW